MPERQRLRSRWPENGSHDPDYRPTTARAAAERRRTATITADAPTTIPKAAATITPRPPAASGGWGSTADAFSSARSEASTFVTGPSAVGVSIAPPTPSPTTTTPTIPRWQGHTYGY